jgi:hypothetical protein
MSVQPVSDGIKLFSGADSYDAVITGAMLAPCQWEYRCYHQNGEAEKYAMSLFHGYLLAVLSCGITVLSCRIAALFFRKKA